MYSSRRHLYGSRHYFLWSFIFAFLRRGALHRCEIPTGNSKVRRWSGVLLPVLFLVGLMSLPLSISLVRNYQWERSRPPTTVVPDLIGLPLLTGTERAHSVHLMTKVVQGGAPVTKTYWYAPGVGMVKSMTDTGAVKSTTELLEHSSN